MFCKSLKLDCPLCDCIVVYFDIPLEVRRERLKKRSDWDSVERRIAADEADFKGFEDYDVIVKDPMYDPAELMNDLLSKMGY